MEATDRRGNRTAGRGGERGGPAADVPRHGLLLVPAPLPPLHPGSLLPPGRRRPLSPAALPLQAAARVRRAADAALAASFRPLLPRRRRPSLGLLVAAAVAAGGLGRAAGVVRGRAISHPLSFAGLALPAWGWALPLPLL
jgi:hypothetical protein